MTGQVSWGSEGGGAAQQEAVTVLPLQAGTADPHGDGDGAVMSQRRCGAGLPLGLTTHISAAGHISLLIRSS
ncbi:hypothetical protein TREES_T100009406 [Tupaia chinensis]|uniref:Uncharacterized protein n=1 Tax=Tupaia chinensis TaxID=246437 RepID=L9JE31_TUPCH|nr:hypothetical protein TREES_T100009406 [Tupaia chinensis]